MGMPTTGGVGGGSTYYSIGVCSFLLNDLCMNAMSEDPQTSFVSTLVTLSKSDGSQGWIVHRKAVRRS